MKAAPVTFFTLPCRTMWARSIGSGVALAAEQSKKAELQIETRQSSQ